MVPPTRLTSADVTSIRLASALRLRSLALAFGLTSACSDEVAIKLLEPARAMTDGRQDEPLEAGGAVTEEDAEEPGISVDAGTDGELADAGSGLIEDPALDGDASAVDWAESANAALVHHYDFAGEGIGVVDKVGGADGVLIGGAELDGTGSVELDGIDDYVNLPNGLVSPLPAVTIAVWLEWHGGACWQRIFDVGSALGGEDTASRAVSSLFVTPASCSASHVGPVQENVVSAMFHVPGSVYIAAHDAALPLDVPVFVALAADASHGLRVYVDGVAAAETVAPLDISLLDDVNTWLGRSQWGQDPMLAARLDDVRIYDESLSVAQVRAVFDSTRSSAGYLPTR